MAKSKKNDKLTENQFRLLEKLTEDKLILPGRLEAQSYRKLERLGFATSEHVTTKYNARTGVTEFNLAYKRTQRGSEFVCDANFHVNA